MSNDRSIPEYGVPPGPTNTTGPSVEGEFPPRDGFNRNTEMWIWIPEEELDRIYQRVDLGESKPVRAFLWPHNDQVKELELLKFIPATILSEKVAYISALEQTASDQINAAAATVERKDRQLSEQNQELLTLRANLAAEKARADGLEKEVSELKGAFAVIPSDFTSQKHYEDMLTQAQARISELEKQVEWLNKDKCEPCSAKESLLVAVRALNSSQAHAFYCPFIETKELNPSEIDCDACNALREIRQAGNYPIPEGEE